MVKWLISILLFGPSSMASELLHLKSGPQSINVLELYSSEGCSSCPPKDVWFSTLRKDPGLWTKFVPVAFHVDYWNYLGWVDPYSKSAFSERQQHYAIEWRNQHIYTPGLVLNGSEWRPSIPSTAYTSTSIEKVGILDVAQKGGGRFEISFIPSVNASDWHIYGALLGNGLSSSVKTGENEGQQLQHDFVVVDFADSKLISKGGAFIGQLELSQPAWAMPKSSSVVFWVAKEGTQKPIQAVGADLKDVLNAKGGPVKKYEKPDTEKLKSMLSSEEYSVTQNEGTERPFANKYWNNHEDGIYVDVVTGEPLFSSRDKFDSGTGWPSFTKPIDDANIKKRVDRKLFLGARTEVRSKSGDSHLGHVFDDGPAEKGGQRYCINSAALKFIPASKLKENGYEIYASLFAKK